MEEAEHFEWSGKDKDMTNREWLNTLSDEEFYNATENLIDKCEWCPEYNDGKMTCKDDHCVRNGIAWLQEPHDVTADEDFMEIGFYQMNFTDFGKPSEVVSYGFGDDKYMVAICKDGQNVYTADTGLRWTDELIDQIRTIADKKRVEMWWK